VLLTEGLWSREFVGDFKDGKNLFVAGQAGRRSRLCREGDPRPGEVVEPRTQGPHTGLGRKESLIPAAQIVRVARAMGKAGSKCAVWMGPGVAMHPRGTYSAMAVHALNGLLGSIDAEGGVWQSSSAPTTKFPAPTSTSTTWPRPPARARSSTAAAPRTCRR
jgi:anaerobic selenocysteine-containing dehydrogenase